MPQLTFKALGGFLFWVIAPLLIGWWLAQSLMGPPAVGVVTLQSDIWAGSADLVLRQLEMARENDNIKAIVFKIDSPGGEVVATQMMYAEVLALRQEKPVVGSIGSVAASGGFYLAMATDPIYAQPSSDIGNMGVWGYVPPDVAVNDIILASGPFKLTASNPAEFLHEIETIKREFLETVKTQRGEKLSLSDEELSQGLTYAGRAALQNGMIDRLGSLQEATDQAAKMAGIANYEVLDLQLAVILELEESGLWIEPEPWLGAADPFTGARNLPPGIYVLYDGWRR